MNYKIGDKVKIRTDLLLDGIYGGVHCTMTMKSYGGNKYTIKNIYIDNNNIIVYELEECVYRWTEEMFEPVEPLDDYNPMQAILDIVNKLNNTNIELGEEFKIVGDDDTFHFDKNSLYFTGEKYIGKHESSMTLALLVSGKLKVVQTQWQPKLYDNYYCLSMNTECGYYLAFNAETEIDKKLIKYGKITRTKAEMIELRNQQEWWKLEDIL